MAQKEVVVWVCDMCGAETEGDEPGIEKHTVRLDQRTVDVEVCETCMTAVREVLDPLLAAGRRVPKAA